ncbi:ATP-grasp domain-containing protein [Georgenia faecalis]|uniref:ATP-grasp domain-containing protein n=1 Tax=Georgenia faecalis TaxID=2483799 RepID=UPI0013DED79C|nr:ATP-grasp domain-containing protein [Georgenia faecalis]
MSNTLLITAVGRRVYVIEELVAAARPDDIILVTDRDVTAPAMSVAGALPVVAPPQGGVDEWLLDLCQRMSVDAVLSLHDYEAVAITRLAAKMAKTGTIFIGPDETAAITLIDKIGLARHLEATAPDLAVSTWPAMAISEQSASGYVLKDRFGSASSGLTTATTSLEAADLAKARNATAAWHPHGGTAPTELVAQPMLAGTEYNVDLFIGNDGSLAGHCVKRKRAMRGGETDSAEVLVHGVEALAEAAYRAIHGLRITGNVDVDILECNDGRLAVIDVNPRFGGGYAFSALAGYGAARGVWSLARSEPIAEHFGPTRELIASKYVATKEVTAIQHGQLVRA